MMGVASIHSISIPEGKAGQQVVESLCKQIEALGAEKSGQFSVECETYYSSFPNVSKFINLFHNSEYPATCFALQDNGTSLVADSSFDIIMGNLASVYASKKANKYVMTILQLINLKFLNRIECRGPRYTLSDFIIKVGSCSFGPSFKGILVEIEYGPCLVPNNCWDLIKEFGQGFLGNQITQPPQYLQGKMNETYSPIDTIHQYNEHFNNLRKITAVRTL